MPPPLLLPGEGKEEDEEEAWIEGGGGDWGSRGVGEKKERRAEGGSSSCYCPGTKGIEEGKDLGNAAGRRVRLLFPCFGGRF